MTTFPPELRLQAALSNAWRSIQQQHPDVPDVVLVVGADGRGKLYGHFCGGIWQRHDGAVSEVLIAGDGLNRPAGEVFGTLLHEAAHARNNAHNIKDTSRQGRYHNWWFRKAAEDFGLSVEDDLSNGCAHTDLAIGTASVYRSQIDRLARNLDQWRTAKPKRNRTQARATGWLKATCPCGRIIRLSLVSFDLGSITCGLCKGSFQIGDGLDPADL